MKWHLYFVLLCALISSKSFAQETSPVPAPTPTPPFAAEAEAGAVVVSGVSDSESYSAQAKGTYTQDKNIYGLFGHYIQVEANGVESARNWDAGVRYDRELNEYLGVYLGQKSESDIYSGYVQRDSTDVGAKYFLIKGQSFNWTLEAGYRYAKTLPLLRGSLYESFGRLYTEVDEDLSKTLSFKYWAEYLPNFTHNEAYQCNTEASLNVMLTQIFSLKLAYLLQYQNVPPSGGVKYATTTSTMNLVAKY